MTSAKPILLIFLIILCATALSLPVWEELDQSTKFILHPKSLNVIEVGETSAVVNITLHAKRNSSISSTLDDIRFVIRAENYSPIIATGGLLYSYPLKGKLNVTLYLQFDDLYHISQVLFGSTKITLTGSVYYSCWLYSSSSSLNQSFTIPREIVPTLKIDDYRFKWHENYGFHFMINSTLYNPHHLKANITPQIWVYDYLCDDIVAFMSISDTLIDSGVNNITLRLLPYRTWFWTVVKRLMNPSSMEWETRGFVMSIGTTQLEMNLSINL